MNSFENLEVWQKARVLVRDIYRHSNNGDFARDFGLRDQIRRAAVSVVSNISEGFERESNKEYVYFLNIAKGSVGEVRAQFYIALDLGYISKDDFDQLSSQAVEISKMVWGLIRYLKTKS